MSIKVEYIKRVEGEEVYSFVCVNDPTRTVTKVGAYI